MAHTYRTASLDERVMNTRISRPRSKLKPEEGKAVYLAILDTIAEIVDLVGYTPAQVLSRLLADLTPVEAEGFYEAMKNGIDPIAYIIREEEVVAVFTPEDAYRPRLTDHQATEKFMTLKDIINIPGRLEMTDRGRRIIREAVKE